MDINITGDVHVIQQCWPSAYADLTSGTYVTEEGTPVTDADLASEPFFVSKGKLVWWSSEGDLLWSGKKWIGFDGTVNLPTYLW